MSDRRRPQRAMLPWERRARAQRRFLDRYLADAAFCAELEALARSDDVHREGIRAFVTRHGLDRVRPVGKGELMVTGFIEVARAWRERHSDDHHPAPLFRSQMYRRSSGWSPDIGDVVSRTRVAVDTGPEGEPVEWDVVEVAPLVHIRVDDLHGR